MSWDCSYRAVLVGIIAIGIIVWGATMKKNIKGIYLFELLLFILVIIFNIFKASYAFQILLIISALFCYLRFGYVKDNAYEKSNVNRVVIASVMAFAIIIYGLGLFTGFSRLELLKSVEGIIYLTLLSASIISAEIIRYIVAKNCTKSTKPLVILTIIFIILNIITQISGITINGRWEIFVLISTIIIPIAARELLCSYISYKCSSVPNMILRISMEVIIHMMPIIPNLGDYLYAVVRILLPAVVFFLSSKIFKYHEKSGVYTKKASRRVVLLPVILLSFVMVYLVSGLFSYKMIAIASGSMEPVFYKGDAVIYKKVEASDLKVGDILAFSKGHQIVTHRILSINIDGNGKYDIITKGDNNNTKDGYVVQKDDVLGIVIYSVKYVGYPTLWINKLIEG